MFYLFCRPYYWPPERSRCTYPIVKPPYPQSIDQSSFPQISPSISFSRSATTPAAAVEQGILVPGPVFASDDTSTRIRFGFEIKIYLVKYSSLSRLNLLSLRLFRLNFIFLFVTLSPNAEVTPWVLLFVLY